jgi:hypothetical protein
LLHLKAALMSAPTGLMETIRPNSRAISIALCPAVSLVVVVDLGAPVGLGAGTAIGLDAEGCLGAGGRFSLGLLLGVWPGVELGVACRFDSWTFEGESSGIRISPRKDQSIPGPDSSMWGSKPRIPRS